MYRVRNPTVGYIQGHTDVVYFIFGSITTAKNGTEEMKKHFGYIQVVLNHIFFQDN